MNLLIIIAVFALSAAAQLPSRNYIPQSHGGSGGQGSYQSFQSSSSSAFVGGGGSGDSGNRRAQQDNEKNAATLKQDQEMSEDGSSYHFGFETSNGIRAEEAGNPTQAQGGFSYKGDDGLTYTITYTSGEGGFRPQGEHLPVAPPTPEAILEALRKNEQDEAAGIFDDGKYHPEKHGGGQSSSFGSSGGGFVSASHQSSFSSNTGYQY